MKITKENVQLINASYVVKFRFDFVSLYKLRPEYYSYFAHRPSFIKLHAIIEDNQKRSSIKNNLISWFFKFSRPILKF